MSLLHIIGLIVVALLVTFLQRRHEARVCRLFDERTLPGHGIDVTVVSQRIQRVRENYVAMVRARPRDHNRRRQLHATARCALKRRAYFRHGRTEAGNSPQAEPHLYSN